MTRSNYPAFHLRRGMRQQAQEARRAQRAAVAEQIAHLDRMAQQIAAANAQAIAYLAEQQEQAVAAAEGSPQELADLRRRLH